MPDIEIGTVEGGSRRLRGYLAQPLGHGPWPGVIAIHEMLGLNDMVRRQADRLAGAGYLTLAPDLFSDGGALRCIVGTFRAMSSGRGKPIADIEAARRHVLADPNSNGKIGIIGFCMGGGFALVMASSGFDAASANYGQLPKHPDRALRDACPIVGSYGGKDVSLRGAARKLESTLDGLNVANDIKEYPTAGHSFLNDEYFGPPLLHPIQRIGNVGPDPLAAADAWKRIEKFFAEHLTA